jgi:sensor histidine kinase YesM
MSAWRPSRPFVVNDLGYRPFGQGWLRGITPNRLALAYAAGVFYAFIRLGPIPLLMNGVTSWYFHCIFIEMGSRHFAAALPMLWLVAWAERAAVSWETRRRVATLAMAVVLGAFAMALVMWGLSSIMVNRNLASFYAAFPWWFVNLVFQGLVWGGLATATAYGVARAREAERARHQARVDALRMERDTDEARLQLLHAQIEPHFLFNTLASVKRLQATDPVQGRELVRNLRQYLTVAIPRGRENEVTLGEEVALAQAWLEILQVRMGSRLRIEVGVAAGLNDALIPPLMLGTLVENAVKHGIAPRASGGSVRIEAAREQETLLLRVIDDGVGFRAHSGRGVGLANTRARLQAMFGERAGLGIRGNPQGGVTAEVWVPWRCTVLARAA